VAPDFLDVVETDYLDVDSMIENVWEDDEGHVYAYNKGIGKERKVESRGSLTHQLYQKVFFFFFDFFSAFV
jgi:hypothetical protein